MTECAQCGMCCECIILPYNDGYIEVMAKEENKEGWFHGDFSFAHRNFIEISRKQALKINPYLSAWNQKAQYFYICKQFCHVTKKCIVHEIRPDVCREFPWYGRKPEKQPLYSKDCSFQKDLKKLNKPKAEKVKIKNGTRKSH